MKQPNPKFRSAADLNTRDREHYEVALGIAGWFNKQEFVQRYALAYPARNEGSIIPSDYCFNLDNKGNSQYPRFLEWDGRKPARYRFVGLGGPGGAADSVELPRAVPGRTPPIATEPLHDRSWQRGGSRFKAREGSHFTLNPDTARSAIRAYNGDPRVVQQERQAASALGSGFAASRVAQQLSALDRAYSTRSVGADLLVIAKRIEDGFDRWTELLSKATPLLDGVPDIDILGELMAFFLDGPTRRTPRSLATKALHFASPKCFIPADAYAANLLGELLGAGSWSDTATLDSPRMAQWFHDYLGVVHEIGKANRVLMSELLAVDAETAPGPQNERVRGLPKIVDKILWWLGRPDHAVTGRPALFR